MTESPLDPATAGSAPRFHFILGNWELWSQSTQVKNLFPHPTNCLSNNAPCFKRNSRRIQCSEHSHQFINAKAEINSQHHDFIFAMKMNWKYGPGLCIYFSAGQIHQLNGSLLWTEELWCSVFNRDFRAQTAVCLGLYRWSGMQTQGKNLTENKHTTVFLKCSCPLIYYYNTESPNH